MKFNELIEQYMSEAKAGSNPKIKKVVTRIANAINIFRDFDGETEKDEEIADKFLGDIDDLMNKILDSHSSQTIKDTVMKIGAIVNGIRNIDGKKDRDDKALDGLLDAMDDGLTEILDIGEQYSKSTRTPNMNESKTSIDFPDKKNPNIAKYYKNLSDEQKKELDELEKKYLDASGRSSKEGNTDGFKQAGHFARKAIKLLKGE